VGGCAPGGGGPDRWPALRNQTVARPIPPGADAAVARRSAERQLVALARSCPLDEIIAVRAISLRIEAAVATAALDPHAAGALLAAVGALPPGATTEAVLTLASIRAPAEALVAWKRGRPDEAEHRLREALADTGALMADFGHDHLTGKRLHLGRNVARVWASAGRPADAAQLADRLLAVAGGDHRAWPFSAAAALRIPLPSPERELIEVQLLRLRPPAPAPAGVSRPR
jgi:hypothetical protein